MWRDRWFAMGVVGACLACLTPVVVLVLGAIGLGAWTGRLVVVLLPLLAGFVVHRVLRVAQGCRVDQVAVEPGRTRPLTRWAASGSTFP